jgi:hypothetical protein
MDQLADELALLLHAREGKGVAQAGETSDIGGDAPSRHDTPSGAATRVERAQPVRCFRCARRDSGWMLGLPNS